MLYYGCARVRAISFSRIAQVLVISPIERMMQLVKMLARNPLDSTTQVTGQGSHGTADGQQSTKAGYETLLLENTLAKIGALMQVGFGAAGAEIIGKNMGSGEPIQWYQARRLSRSTAFRTSDNSQTRPSVCRKK